MKRRAESRGQGHVVLPPASIVPTLGSDTAYWQTFYNTVASGLSGSGTCAQTGLPVSQLTALHTHFYNWKTPTDPLGEVAQGATRIRKGHDWYKNTYNGGNSLPLDYLLSESGPSWEILLDPIDPTFQGKAWSGGYPDLLQGLSYWNSWLCWITRRAPAEMNLQNWSSGAHVMYACIHQPDLPPYAISNTSSNGTRNQWYFSLDAWNTYVYYNAPVYLASNLASVGLQYQNSFSYFTPTTWNAKTWYLGPFGACYHVWSKVGADPTVTQFGAGGWYNDSGVAGLIGGTNVTVLGGGWSTIYIPFIKNTGAFYNVSPPVQFTARWQKGDGSYRDQGYLDLSLFKDTTSYTVNGYTQTVYSSMILPLVVYNSSSQPKTFRLELTRNINGPSIIIGRPIVLGGVACSWSTIN